MSKAAKNLMRGGRGGRQGKIAIKKTVNRGGKSFQQTFYVSPQEAMAMQRKAKKEMMQRSQPRARQEAKKKPKVSPLVEKASKEFGQVHFENLAKKLRTPNDDGLVIPEPPPVEEHIEIAKRALAKHHKTLGEKKALLKKLSPPGAIIKARVKEMESAVGKVQRKPKYGTADKLQDLTGTRVVMGSSSEVLATVDKLRREVEVLEEDDYITPPDPKEVARAQELKASLGKKEFESKHPKEAYLLKRNTVMEPGYRSFHMIAKDRHGNIFEVQLRTRDQNTFAEWSHPIYKPTKPEEIKYAGQHREELLAYGRQVSQFFVKRETNPKLSPPPCPTVVARSPFGCIGE